MQLLVALDALRNVGVLHADIKPDNVMLVSGQEQPLRIKLIDFGEAILASDAKPGMLLQPIGYRCLNPEWLICYHYVILCCHYLLSFNLWLFPPFLRAPEIALGLPFTQAIDVWGVGCVLAFLYLTVNLFPVNCDYQMVGQLPQTNVYNQIEPLFIMSTVTECFLCR